MQTKDIKKGIGYQNQSSNLAIFELDLYITNNKNKGFQMAFTLNKVQLLGNVEDDPKLQDNVCTLYLSTVKAEFDKDTNLWSETPETHFVVIKKESLVQSCIKHVTKGNRIFVEGILTYKTFKDQNGKSRITPYILLSQYEGNMILLGNTPDPSKKNNFQNKGGFKSNNSYSPRTANPPYQQQKPSPQPSYHGEDDIPF